MSEQQFYTIEEIARMLRVSVAKVRQMVRSGEIESILVGNQYRISEENWQRFLEKQSHK